MPLAVLVTPQADPHLELAGQLLIIHASGEEVSWEGTATPLLVPRKAGQLDVSLWGCTAV